MATLDYIEKAHIVFEFESMLLWRRNKGTSSYTFLVQEAFLDS